MLDSAIPATNVFPLRQVGDWWVMEVRGARDIPDYDPEEVGRGITSPGRYRAEVLGDWSASPGKLVYPDFDPEFHVAGCSLVREVYSPRLPLLIGWDLPAATGGTKSAVPTQLSAAGQWLLFPSVDEDPTRGETTYQFGQRVLEHLQALFGDPWGVRAEELRLRHIADPAGKQTAIGGANARERKSAYDILRHGEAVVVDWDERGHPVHEERPGLGWVMEPGVVSFKERSEKLAARLQPLDDGSPALLVDPDAVMVRDGLGGGYHYPQRQDGQYEFLPAQNQYCHPLAALEYVASRLGKASKPAYAVPPRRESGPGFASHAAGRARRGRG